MFKDGSLSLFSPMRQSLSSVNTIYCMNYEPEDRAYVMQRLYKPCTAARQYRVGSGAIVPGYCGFGYEFSIYHLSIIHTGLLVYMYNGNFSGFLPHLPLEYSCNKYSNLIGQLEVHYFTYGPRGLLRRSNIGVLAIF